ncbi:hypothetical protein ANN_21529 [Periplaneta americana]|uniref:Uncharacterized protein n=1 Tax=Periplaneta americana TaxID=6978 RepID=A0ABQ8SGI2_PERAM|nr:hypothetical protein ANN_21529 [Periplaneta americana]
MAGLCEGGNEPPGSLKANKKFLLNDVSSKLFLYCILYDPLETDISTIILWKPIFQPYHADRILDESGSIYIVMSSQTKGKNAEASLAVPQSDIETFDDNVHDNASEISADDSGSEIADYRGPHYIILQSNTVQNEPRRQFLKELAFGLMKNHTAVRGTSKSLHSDLRMRINQKVGIEAEQPPSQPCPNTERVKCG